MRALRLLVSSLQVTLLASSRLVTLLAASAAIILLAACSGASEPESMPPQSHPAQVAQVTAFLASHLPVPSPLQDGAMAQRALGQAGGLGPTDYQWWVYARVDVDQVDNWTVHFKPLAQRPEPVAAPDMQRWPSLVEFPTLEFYEANGLSMYNHGWIAVARSSGEIFLYKQTQ